ncbi:DNA topoisomerase [Acerihabitans sp. TG2]|uniref:DNA topoisomerase n=1 Tax=Acerihabitans sp. TG2 TaxID=3096008 RepID=UPI002B230C34|nr:DNA topoisomerase [Acerihabitans sp. TG2]MEA9392178.1 DNA topoisomerase [Acerihabitans sp. TG2]
MKKPLIIAEKPSVAAQIAKSIGHCQKKTDCFEGDDAIVSYAFGHLVEIFSSELEELQFGDLASLPVIPDKFSIRPTKATAKQLSALKRLIQRDDVSMVVNACDAGREGELIFRLIYQMVGGRKPVKRMWIKSMTDEGLRESFKNMHDGQDYDRLDQAARSRAEADYLLGMNMTRAVSALKRVETGQQTVSSCGRVQTPVLTLIVDRELEIKNFVPRDFWVILGKFGVNTGDYVGKWINSRSEVTKDGEDEKNRFYDIKQAEAILNKCRNEVPTRVEETSAVTRQKPPKLFNQTELQRESNRRYKFSALETLNLTQALYERHKLVTYPRTSSQALPEGDVESVVETLSTAFEGTQYEDFSRQIVSSGWVNGDNKAIFDNSKITDHFAIIPAPGSRCNVSALTDDERKIYDLIVRRFMAVFFPSAEYNESKRHTHIAGEVFYTSGKVLINAGWKTLYPQTSNDTQLCALQPGENAENHGIGLKASETTPPARYNPDTLLGAMQTAGKFIDNEELATAMKGCGLGTDATRAGIIEQLQKNKTSGGKSMEPYMVCEGKRQEFVPTSKAIDLISFLKKTGISILTSPILTGQWEQKLALIEDGSIRKQDFMFGIAEQTRECVQIIKNRAIKITGKPLIPYSSSNASIVEGDKFCSCPGCSGDVIKLTNPFIKFRCNNCSFLVNGIVANRVMNDDEIKQLIETGTLDARAGYKSKAGRTFTTALDLDKKTGAISFNFRD